MAAAQSGAVGGRLRAARAGAAGAYAWFRDLHLRPGPAALLGAGAGALVGGAITAGMVRRATFTGPHQGATAGAILVAIWILIGIVGGLTVLSPVDDDTRHD
jgi:hypothetical protein